MSAGRARGVHGMELLYALVYIIAVDVGKRQTEIVENADLNRFNHIHKKYRILHFLWMYSVLLKNSIRYIFSFCRSDTASVYAVFLPP